jgi:8-oxo-dGTP pyrophosphatase MutT (NUDIX family)
MNKILNSVWKDVVHPLLRRPKRLQVAALCHRGKGDNKEVLMITSRGTGRWIIPKGWPMRGLDDHESALQEAWEEAGVRESHAAPEPIGTFTYDKVQESGWSYPVETLVYSVKVKELAETFPEVEQRDRKWMAPKEAANLVQEEELKAILQHL